LLHPTEAGNSLNPGKFVPVQTVDATASIALFDNASPAKSMRFASLPQTLARVMVWLS
jgi:hypothetical protein